MTGFKCPVCRGITYANYVIRSGKILRKITCVKCSQRWMPTHEDVFSKGVKKRY